MEGPMNGRQARAARAAAHWQAQNTRLWARGEGQLMTWWRKALARLFPRLRRKYKDIVGAWYKRTLKRWAHIIYAQKHDRDMIEFERVRQKLSRRK